MEWRKRSAYRHHKILRTPAKTFGKILYLTLGIVICSYLILFIMVVSRHLEKYAEEKLRKAVTASEAGSSKLSTFSKNQEPAKFLDNAIGGNNGLGIEKFKDRWAAIARVFKDSESDPAHPKRKVLMCTRPKFRNPPGPITALASFPGSGNTWIRFLVQQATGILTGSIYRDYSLKRNGFPAESVANGSVLLIKTHEFGETTRSRFQKVVLLVRDPYHALLAEFNRRAGGHVGHAAPDKFYKGKTWKRFALIHAKAWMDSTLDWLLFKGPLHILRYEAMVEDLPNELLRLLKFLGVADSISWATFQCVIRNKDGIFRRAKRPLQFDPFDDSMKEVIDHFKSIVNIAVKLREKSYTFNTNNITAITPDSLNFHTNHTNNGGETYVEKIPSGKAS